MKKKERQHRPKWTDWIGLLQAWWTLLHMENASGYSHCFSPTRPLIAGDCRRKKSDRRLEQLYLQVITVMRVQSDHIFIIVPTRIVRLQLLIILLSNTGNVGSQVKNPTTISPFVVIPAHELDEIRVQRDPSFDVENRRMRVPIHVARDNVILGVIENTCSVLDLLL